VINRPKSKDMKIPLVLTCGGCKKNVVEKGIPYNLFILAYLSLSLFVTHLIIHHLLPMYDIQLKTWGFLLSFLLMSTLTIYSGIPYCKPNHPPHKKSLR
jgi:hypothetical protein